MTFKELLVKNGLAEDAADKIIAAMPTNKFYITSEENLSERYIKLKEQKGQVDEDLKEANKLIEGLKVKNSDSTELQTQIDDYKKQVETLEKEREADTKHYAIREALTSAGATDVEYLTFKLGEVELDRNGAVKNLDNKVKDLKANHPTLFKTEEHGKADEKNPPPGFKAIGDNKLQDGKQTVTYTKEQLKSLTPQEINENWDAVQAALTGGNE